MSSRFYFGGSDSGSDLDDDNDASLPFPKPIDRSAFLAPDFDATAFLSSLSNRFQTLEDLQTELRELSQTLNKELVDLVNDNYQDFLSLGSTLAGGEEKVEDIRVGLLGFQREVKAVRDKLDARRDEVVALLGQRRALKQETSVGRSLLEIAERLDQLEQNLDLKTGAATTQVEGTEVSNGGWSQGWIEAATNESDDEYDSDEERGIPPKLSRRTQEFLVIKHLVGRHSPHHPFILAQDFRIRRIQEVLLADLDVAIKQEPEIKLKQKMLQLRAAVED